MSASGLASSQPRIYTHRGVNADSAFAVALFMSLVPEFNDAEVYFMDAEWNGHMGPMQVAVDLNTGGVGFKGEVDGEGRVHSAFEAVLQTYGALAEDKRIMDALKPLAQFLDSQEAYGSEGIRMIVPNLTESDAEFITDHSLIGTFRIMVGIMWEQAESIGESPEWADYQLVCFARDYLRLYVRQKIAYMNAEANVARAIRKQKIIIREEGKVALCFDPIKFVQLVLFRNYGIRAVVIVEDKDNIVVRRKDSERTRMDHPLIREVIERAGETIGSGGNGWFAHSSGFLLAWQTRKSERRGRRTNVDAWDMAEAVERAILATDLRTAEAK